METEYKFSYKLTFGRRLIIQNWLILYMYPLTTITWLFLLFFISNIVSFGSTPYSISDQLYWHFMNGISLIFMTTIVLFIFIEIFTVLLIILTSSRTNTEEEVTITRDRLISKIGEKILEFNFNSISNPRILGKYIFLKIQNVPGLIFTIYVKDSKLREKVLNLLKNKKE
jgi:hypothetical protein